MELGITSLSPLLGMIGKGPQHSLAQVAEIIARSPCDIGSEEACIDALIAAGVRPWQFTGNLLDARVHAHNIRTWTLITRLRQERLQRSTACEEALS